MNMNGGAPLRDAPPDAPTVHDGRSSKGGGRDCVRSTNAPDEYTDLERSVDAGVWPRVLSYLPAANLRDAACASRGLRSAASSDPRCRTSPGRLGDESSWVAPVLAAATSPSVPRDALLGEEFRSPVHATLCELRCAERRAVLRRAGRAVSVTVPPGFEAEEKGAGEVKGVLVAGASWAIDVGRAVIVLRRGKELHAVVYLHTGLGRTEGEPDATDAAPVGWNHTQLLVRSARPAATPGNGWNNDDEVEFEMWCHRYPTVFGMMALSGDGLTLVVLVDAKVKGMDSEWIFQGKVAVFDVRATHQGRLDRRPLEIPVGDLDNDYLNFNEWDLSLLLSADGNILAVANMSGQCLSEAALISTVSGEKVVSLLPNDSSLVAGISSVLFERDTRLVMLYECYGWDPDEGPITDMVEAHQAEQRFPAALRPLIVPCEDDATVNMDEKEEETIVIDCDDEAYEYVFDHGLEAVGSHWVAGEPKTRCGICQSTETYVVCAYEKCACIFLFSGFFCATTSARRRKGGFVEGSRVASSSAHRPRRRDMVLRGITAGKP